MPVPSTFLDQVFIRKVCAFAGNSLLVYDYLLTLSLEVTYIWHAPWTLVKALFLINRYGNLFGQTVVMLGETGYLSHGSPQFCVIFQIYCSVFGVFSGESIRLLVVMRACAILRCRASFALLLKVSYVIYALAMLVMVNYLMSSFHPQFDYLSETGVCFVPIPSKIWMIWLILLFFDGAILLIVCYNLYQLTRGYYGVHPLRLIHLLTRDTLFFYFATVFNVVLCIRCWSIYSQDPRNFIQILITCPFISVLGQRLILNLRRFRGRQDPSYNFGLAVNREVVVMDDEHWHRQSRRGVGVGSAARDGTSSGMIQMVDLYSHSSDHGSGRRNRSLGHDVLQECKSERVSGEDKVGELHPVSLSEDME